MKKLITVLSLLALAFSLSACQSDADKKMGDEALTQYAVSSRVASTIDSMQLPGHSGVVWTQDFTPEVLRTYLQQNALAWRATCQYFGTIPTDTKPSK